MENFFREIEPTLLPESDTPAFGHCPICKRPIFADDNIILIEGGASETVVHENCAVFEKDSLIEFLEMIQHAYYQGIAREMYDDKYGWI